MTPESIFTIIFMIISLSIPFGLGLGLWRAIGTKREIDALLSESIQSTGRVVGYTERTFDPDNITQHYAVIEYPTDRDEVVWAESEGCDKGAWPINAEVEVMYHPRDRRSVMVVADKHRLRLRIGFEKSVLLVTNLIFAILIFTSLAYYRYPWSVIITLLFVYLGGFVFGAIIKSKNRHEERTRVLQSKLRDDRLIAAQRVGNIPCSLKE